MWNVEPTDNFERQLRHFEKKHPNELKATLGNLQRYLDALNEGGKPEIIQFGFIHREPQGVVAIDQKGGGKNLKQTRLYTYGCHVDEELHLITIGDKQSQKSDIALCKSFVTALRKTKEEQ